MIDKSQIRGLEKLLNSDIIKNIYPIIGNISVEYFENELGFLNFSDKIILNIYLNDPSANNHNLWDEFQLDQHYLIDHHIRNLLPYINIDNEKTIIRYRIYNTEFDIISRNDL